MTDQFSNYIKSSVKEVLETSGYSVLTGEERKKLEKSLENHFENLIFETFVNRLDEGQAEDIRKNISSGSALEDKFTEYAALIPDLTIDIEDRIGREVEALKMLAG